MIGFYRNTVETTPADHRARRVSRASSHQSPASSLQESRLVAGPLSPSQMCASGRGDRVPNKCPSAGCGPRSSPIPSPLVNWERKTCASGSVSLCRMSTATRRRRSACCEHAGRGHKSRCAAKKHDDQFAPLRVELHRMPTYQNRNTEYRTRWCLSGGMRTTL
jgi:hypothetical protein